MRQWFRLLTNNLGWKLLSLAVATALWLLLQKEAQRAAESPTLYGGSSTPLLLEPMLSREVPVEVRFDGIPAKGERIASVEVTPDRVRLLGPQKAVVPILSAPTEPVPVEGLASSRDFVVPVVTNDPQVRIEGSPQVRVRVKLRSQNR